MARPTQDLFNKLPVELILQIAQYIERKKLKSFAQASRRLRIVIGPRIYHTQVANSIDDLARLGALADQPDVAHMVINLEVDTIPMRSWWPSIGRRLCTLLPKLANLESLHMQTSHCIPNQLSVSISRLRKLHTLHIKLVDTRLGPYAGTIARLRHLSLDLPHPSTTKPHTHDSLPFDDLITLLSNSRTTLETLTLRSATPESTAGFAFNLIHSPARPLQKLLSSTSSLKSIRLQLMVNTSTLQTIATIDAISTLGPKLTSLSLRCKPSMYPEQQPSDGYGIGLEVVQRICEKLPQLQELTLEDGEVGRSNIHRGGIGVAEEHLKSLLCLRNLRTVKFALLFDDLLYSLEPLNPPDLPDIIVHSIFHASAVAKQRFNVYVDENFTQVLHSILFDSAISDEGIRNFPLAHLQSIKINTVPSPKLAILLRGFRIPAGASEWRRNVAWSMDHEDHLAAEFVS